jgi:hypothetical protein
LKKIKVTRTVHKKVPWYERPTLLFAVIAVCLLVVGIFLARVTGKAGENALRSEVVIAEPAAPEPGMTHVVEIGGALPPTAPGGFLPPIRVGTRIDAQHARVALRAARGEGEPGAGQGEYGYVDGRRIVELARQGALSAQAWAQLPLAREQREWCDFEVQRGETGDAVLLAFVAPEVAEALGALGSDFALAPPDPGASPPWWQIWKKRTKTAGVVLRQGSRIELYPDVDPNADCLVALPVARLVPRGARSFNTGLTSPVDVLEVELR